MKKMKKRYFEQWYHVYWQSRIEWKLNIRADCHNKYALCFAIYALMHLVNFHLYVCIKCVYRSFQSSVFKVSIVFQVLECLETVCEAEEGCEGQSGDGAKGSAVKTEREIFQCLEDFCSVSSC